MLHDIGDDMCTVCVYADTHTTESRDGDTVYVSDLYAVTVAHKPDILDDVKNNYAEWLALCVESEA